MNIGVTAVFKGSVFNESLPQVSVFIARALQSLGHNVSFLLPVESDVWFDDCAFKSDIPVIKLVAGANVVLYDLIIEICWFLPSEVRKQIGERVVMFYHESPAFNDMEKSVYKKTSLNRNFTGVDAIWTWAHFQHTDFSYLEVLSRLPVFPCPFVWEPIFLDSFLKSNPDLNSDFKTNVKPHIIICENNRSNTSSCVIPLSVLSEIKKDEPDVSWTVMNSQQLIKGQYFIKNIVENLYLGDMKDISGNFLGRVRIIDFLKEKCCILSHQRWLPIKYVLLDALWLGIPLIHNCPMLKDMDGGEYYYELNRIGQALNKWDKLKQKCAQKFDKVRLETIRSGILERWGPEKIRNSLPKLLNKLHSLREPVLRLAFCDMWVDFNPDHNFITGAFKTAGVKFTKDLIHPNLVIFGPFGKEHEKFKFIPKVFFTGENLQPIIRDDIKINVGFSHVQNENYTRIPNWLLELNLFGLDETLVRNPFPFNPKLLFRKKQDKRSKFCIFVASRPMCPERNTLYNIVSRYKTVDSAGMVFNNTEWIESGPGGSGGQQAKIKAYEKYKFVIVGENSQTPGYVTEKLLHAKLAGCIPIYWGDPSVHLEFEKGSFLNVADYASENDLLKRIEQLDSNDIEWSFIANSPLLKETTLHNWKERILKFCYQCLNLVKPYANHKTYPFNIDKLNISSNRIIVTACNGKFTNSVIRLIKSKPANVDIFVWVWDITTEQKEKIEKAGAKQVYIFDTSWFPTDFADFWNPEHYAWKPLLWNELQKSTLMKDGVSVLYLDAGIEIVGDLEEVWSNIEKDDIFVCNIEHKMSAWCKPEFSRLLEMTKVEGDTLQYTSAVVGFKTGGTFKNVFTKVAEYGLNSKLITGPKWHHFSKECFGHRQDQSILSIVGIRANAKAHEFAKYTGEISQTESVRLNKAFYLHRGMWKKTLVEELDGIDSIYVINLAHRADRLKQFYESQPFLKHKCERIEAVHGTKLSLNEELIRLFRNNDFGWKKGVIGCALSHYRLWQKLATMATETKILVFEDDAVLVKGFANIWNNIVDSIPSDTDIIMLGGVLPPNKNVLPLVSEQVNEHFARIKTNSFHFCTYSYIITQSGAKKLCNLIEEKGFFTSADHIIVNHMNGLLNFYFTVPLLCGCFQDKDDAYINADFNNYNRIDTYDSEIWNNTERFTASDISGFLPVVYFEKGQNVNCLEQKWHEELTGRTFLWFHYTESLQLMPGTVMFILFQHTTNISDIEEWIQKHCNLTLILLHLSDESCKADTKLYNNPSIKHVFRNYWRPDVVSSKVTHLPLGYNKKRDSNKTLKPILGRKYVWSFAGAMDRPLRKEILESFESDDLEHKLYKTPTWGSSLNLEGEEYIHILDESKIVPCMPGFFNVETYRFYEALESGAIPVVSLDAVNSYTNILNGSVNPPLFAIGGIDWSVIRVLGTQDSILDSTAKDIQNWWIGYKMYLKTLIHTKINLI
jgi:GR25 family glycosyltransferase involved in LPS biosynthesis